MVSHTTSKPTFCRLEGFFEGLSLLSSYVSFFCALTRVVKIIKDGICWLNQAHGVDLLCPKWYTIWVRSTWELEEKQRFFYEKTNSLSSVNSLMLVPVLAVEHLFWWHSWVNTDICFGCGGEATEVGVRWSHHPKYWETNTETRGPDVYICLSIYGSCSWHARCSCGIYRTIS